VNSREPKLRLLPVILPSGQRAKESDIPGFLQGKTWVEFRRSIDEGDALHRLICGIKGIAPGRGPGVSVELGECPFVGLKTFQPEDAPLFLGRAAKIQEMVDRLRNNFGTQKEERFLGLIGASGSGKSSLALAGLIPAVRCGGLPDGAHWPVVRCRPGAQPWENLLIALGNNQQLASHMTALPTFITRPEDEQRRLHITAQLALHHRLETYRLLVLIDQFEEIFTSCNDESARRQFIDNLLYATSVTAGRTIVVLTMRADFLAQCATYPGLRAAISDHQSLVGPLSEEELREVIATPAQLAGGELEPGLMELLLADMKGQAGALPFLEHALFKLWERRDGRRLTAKTYTDMGRLGGALDAHAEEFFTKKLSVEEQTLCRQLLVDLVHPGEGAADTKKRVSLDDVATTDVARAVLIKLADARLVTTSRDEGPEAAQAELAHEALISGWRRLGDWVNESREKSRIKERLLDSAREWRKNSKRDDFLYRGLQLAASEEHFGASTETLPRLGREFLDASSQLKQRLALQEEELKQHELHATILKAEEKNAREVASRANVSLARYSHEAGHEAHALAYLAQALRLNQSNSRAVELVGVMLTQTSCSILLPIPMKHEAEVLSAQLSPDGQQVVTTSGNRTARLWNAQTGKAIGEPMKHAYDYSSTQLYAISSAQFSPDGQHVLTASWDRTARLWNAQTGKAIGEPMKHTAGVSSAQFSPDGQRVVTASWDRTARLWNAQSGKAIGKPMRHIAGVSSAQFSPNGQRVVTTSEDTTARLWDAQTGEAIGEPMKHEAGVSSAQFSPDSQRVVTASEDTTARLWDALTGQAIGEPMKHEAAISSAQFSPDGQRVVTASRDKMARLWDALTGEAIGELMKHEAAVSSAQFSPDGQRVVTASEDTTARLWDAQTGKAMDEPMKHEAAVSSAQFSPDGQRVVTASRDKTARLWHTQTDKVIDEPMKHEAAVSSAQFSPDGQRVVTATWGKTAWLWDAQTGKAIGEPMKHEAAVSSAQFSPDGRRVVTASEDETARLWDAQTGKAIGESIIHAGAVFSAQFNPTDGQRVVTASGDKTARLWDAQTGKAIGEPMRHAAGIASAQFSPDGQRVVTASRDKTVRLWHAQTGKAIGKPMRHVNGVSSAQFSPDSQRVVTTSRETARVWDAAIGETISEPMKHDDVVYSAQFSPDGQRVVTASRDKTARLWDAQTGKAIGEPMRHGAGVFSAQFSPDGQRVVTASEDKTARLWDAQAGKAIGKPMKHPSGVYSARFSPDGQRVVTASDDNTARLWDTLTTSHKDNVDELLLLADLVDATAGVTLNISGQEEVLTSLSADNIEAIKKRIVATFSNKSVDPTPLARFIRWSVSDSKDRTISPFSIVTISQWLEAKINDGKRDALRAAILVDPSNAIVTANFGRCVTEYALENGTDPAESRRARGEADFQTQRALRLAPDNDQVQKLRAEVVTLMQLNSPR
jgi:WD40 repeat protein